MDTAWPKLWEPRTSCHPISRQTVAVTAPSSWLTHTTRAAYKLRIFFKPCFRRKNRGHLQKNRGPTEIILHFFSSFSFFSGFFPLQAVAFQRQAPLAPLQKKSCLKTDGRFSVRPGMCHNRPVKVEMTDRNEGCEGWTAVKRRPALRAKRFGARNDSSAFGHPAGNRRWRARTPKPAALPVPIKPNQS